MIIICTFVKVSKGSNLCPCFYTDIVQYLCQDDQPDDMGSDTFPFSNVTIKREPVDELSPPTTPPDHLETDDETSKYISNYILGLQQEQEQSLMKIFQPKQEQIQDPVFSHSQPLTPPLSVSPKQPLSPPLSISPNQPLSPNQLVSPCQSVSSADGLGAQEALNQTQEQVQSVTLTQPLQQLQMQDVLMNYQKLQVQQQPKTQQQLQPQRQQEDLSLGQLLSQPAKSGQILKILQSQQIQVCLLACQLFK